MKPFASLALALCLTASAQTTFTDPANLRGERPSPRTGRELPIDQGALGLQQLLRKLSTRASLMNIVAHPDDQDYGMLTLNSRGLGARVADLSLTRGEGGQNAMTGDFEDALGLLRTQELLACDRYSGVDQFFGTEVDFGFSKTKEEAFAKWTHDRVLYDTVRAIRLYRPLVLTSTWIGGVTDGHGQHQVSGQIAQEAFLAAGDPKVFPELTAEGILPWQPLKIYARVPRQSITPRGLFDYATGQYTPARFTNYVTNETTSTPPTTDVMIHEGTPDPLLTVASADPSDVPSAYTDPTAVLSYAQFARIGLGLQKSQIPAGFRKAPAGPIDVNYHLYASCISSAPPLPCHPERSAQRAVEGPATKPAPTQPPTLSNPGLDPGFFDGIDTSIEGIATLAPGANPTLRNLLRNLAEQIDRATKAFDPNYTTACAEKLVLVQHQIEIIEHNTRNLKLPAIQEANILHELAIKKVQTNDALALALGLSFDATVKTSSVPVHTPAVIATTLTQTSEMTLHGVLESIEDAAGRSEEQPPVVDNNGVVQNHADYAASLNVSASLTDATSRPYFERSNIEQPIYTVSNPSLRTAPQTPSALVAWADIKVSIATVRVGRIVHHGSQPIQFVPPVSVALSSHAQALPQSSSSFSINMMVTPPGKNITSEKLDTPTDWKIIPESTSANCLGCDPFQIEVPQSGRKPTSLTASVELEDHTYSEGYRPIGYGDLPITNYYTPATTRIVPVNLTLPTHHHIAYLPGTGDAVPEALASINLKPDTLTVADLTPAKLAAYDTVILGVRTYEAHHDLHGAPTQALLDYARNGGNVVVQYQTADFTGADAPYPLDLGSNEKVVDETAPVRLIEDANDFGVHLLVVPNHLSPADFNNWVEERGHGFLSTWDSHYSAPTETHDPGQDPQRGGLITTRLGPQNGKQGRWTYVAFALYRQLPEAVPGAFRLFTNLITP